jgi:hypothetical protein
MEFPGCERVFVNPEGIRRPLLARMAELETQVTGKELSTESICLRLLCRRQILIIVMSGNPSPTGIEPEMLSPVAYIDGAGERPAGAA